MLQANNFIVNNLDSNDHKYNDQPVITLSFYKTETNRLKSDFSINQKAYSMLKLDVPKSNDYIIMARSYMTIIEGEEVVAPIVISTSNNKVSYNTIDNKVTSAKVNKKTFNFYSNKFKHVIFKEIESEDDTINTDDIRKVYLLINDVLPEENSYTLSILDIEYNNTPSVNTTDNTEGNNTENVTMEDVSLSSENLDSVDYQNIQPEIIDHKGTIVQ